MPVAPTYPGVYIEEVPSGVHTITGVATSVTAFIGYTARGLVNVPAQLFSFADFEREFGGLSVDSPVGYAVKDFFQNGGGEAWVVRVAKNAAKAAVTLKSASGTNVLTLWASSEGIWGNQVRVDVDYDTANPNWQFNVTVTSFVERNGQMVVDRTETWRNLSMVSTAPNYVETAINAASDLVTVKRLTAPTGSGSSRSGTFGATDLDPYLLGTNNKTKVAVIVDGKGPFEFDIGKPFAAADAPAVRHDKIATAIMNAVNPLGVTVTKASSATDFTITSASTLETSEVRFVKASERDASTVLKLGAANGGVETIPAAQIRPLQTGTVSAPLATLPTLAADGVVAVELWRGAGTAALETVNLPLWGAGTTVAVPTTLAELLDAVQRALRGSTRAEFAGSQATFVNNRLRILPPALDSDLYFKFVNAGTNTTTATLRLDAAAADINVARYRLGVGETALGQINAVIGKNGDPPGTTELRGSQVDKTGLYALENVDIFNILCLPDVTDASLLAEAIAYCERRRAFMIIDLPATTTSLAKAQTWLAGDGASLRSRNAASYFPRIRESDPLKDGAIGVFPSCGAMAGIYARTDAERGVWKAPAGTMATVSGVAGVAVPLTDMENGVLNQLGLNVIRNFPVYGTVSWGARTMRGADQLADEYKYIPVRRLALFLEESLYRGSKWAVFEPNDEPLWAQLRLNIGAFMHRLFSQGAFQGSSPRDAYLVKCDKETTTQADIDLGRVNILVAFAPLKPAEFVIIRIQQLAGQLQT